MKSILKSLVSFAMIVMVIVGIFGCATVASRVLDEQFLIVDLGFVMPDPYDSTQPVFIEPVFNENERGAIIYFILVNTTVIGDQIALTGQAQITDSDGQVVLSNDTYFGDNGYTGPNSAEWYSLMALHMLPGVGDYIYTVTVIDIFGSRTVTESLDFVIQSGSII